MSEGMHGTVGADLAESVASAARNRWRNPVYELLLLGEPMVQPIACTHLAPSNGGWTPQSHRYETSIRLIRV